MRRICLSCLVLIGLLIAVNAPADSRRSKARKQEIRKKQQKSQTRLNWYTDLNSALKEARRTNRKIFLLITGSTWCGPCKNLERKVLSSREFAQYADQNLILLKVDVPARGAMSADGQKISAKYRSNGVPAIFILDGNGKVLEQKGGYGGAATKDFIKSFKTLKPCR